MIRRAVLAAAAALLLSTSAASAAVRTIHVYTYGYSPSALNIAVGDIANWHNTSNINHNVTPNVPAVWPYIAPGPIVPDHGFSRAMQQAGTFAYHCAIYPNRMKGKVLVKMSSSPTSGTTATTFTITVATVDAASGFAQDIQRRKGGAPFTFWISVASQTLTWEPNSNDAGTWGFRTRYRKTSTGEHSGWSPVLSITVH